MTLRLTLRQFIVGQRPVAGGSLIARLFLVLTLIVFSIETLVMVLLEQLALPTATARVLDGFLLVAILFPLSFLLIVRPMAQQIALHRKTNLELTQTNEVLERFFSISDVLIAYLDPAFNFIRVNQAYAQMDGRLPEHYTGKNHFDCFPNPANEALFQQVVRSGVGISMVEQPFAYLNNGSETPYWDWSLLPVKNGQGAIAGLILVLHDVTARKHAQLALVESERRFRAVFNQTFQHMILCDPEGRPRIANQTIQDFAGLPEEASDTPLWQLPLWGADAAVAQAIQTAVERARTGEVTRFEQPVVGASGQTAVMELSIKPLYNLQGQPDLLLFEARDITDHKQSEAVLKRQQDEVARLYLAEKQAHDRSERLRDAALALSVSLQINTVLDTLLDTLATLVPFTSAHIALYTAETELEICAARGEDGWLEADQMLNKRFEASELPLVDRIIQLRETVSIFDTSLYPDSAFLPVDEHVRSWLGIPLIVGNQCIGVCILEHTCPGFFTEDLTYWANAITSQAGVATQNAWLFEQVQDGRGQLQALSRRLVEAQESERLYIARELHDEAGQSLASLMVGLRLLQHDRADPAAVQEHCDRLKAIADDVLENLHQLAINLRPPSLDHLGLVAALRQHADMIGQQHGLQMQFEAVGKIDRLPVEIETAIYRIVQEAITNVVRHSQATRVDILLERREPDLVVVIEDNGVGFDPQESKAGHLGMLGMRERAVMLGGTLSIESAPGRGATVLLEVPCLFES